MVIPRGFDPHFLGYRPSVLASRRRDQMMVRLAGVEPAASAMSMRRSAVELETRGAR